MLQKHLLSYCHHQRRQGAQAAPWTSAPGKEPETGVLLPPTAGRDLFRGEVMDFLRNTLCCTESLLHQGKREYRTVTAMLTSLSSITLPYNFACVCGVVFFCLFVSLLSSAMAELHLLLQVMSVLVVFLQLYKSGVSLGGQGNTDLREMRISLTIFFILGWFCCGLEINHEESTVNSGGNHHIWGINDRPNYEAGRKMLQACSYFSVIS